MQREETLSNQIKCIRCNAVIVSDDRFCSECGAKVDFGLKGIAELENFFSTKPKIVQQGINKFQCDFCGFKNKKGATFCEKCGGVLQVDVYEPEIIENKKDDESLSIEENVNTNLVENVSVTSKEENEEVEVLQTETYTEYQQEMLDVKQNIEKKFIEEKKNSQTSRYNFYLVAVFLFLLLVFIYMFF